MVSKLHYSNIEWLEGFQCSLEQWQTSTDLSELEKVLVVNLESILLWQRAWYHCKRDHVQLSRPLPRVTRGCSVVPVGSCSELHCSDMGIFLRMEVALAESWPCANNHDTQAASGPRHIPLRAAVLTRSWLPSQGLRSSPSLSPISQTTPFLASFNGSDDTLQPHRVRKSRCLTMSNRGSAHKLKFEFYGDKTVSL